MATILSSKSFFVPAGEFFPHKEVREWLDNLVRGDDVRMVVRLELAGKTRKKKVNAKTELERFVVDAALEHKDVWTHGDYTFSFWSRQYFWKGEELYLTANEALFLFRWLVLNDEIHKMQRFYVRNMRKRLGKEFLADITEGAVPDDNT